MLKRSLVAVALAALAAASMPAHAAALDPTCSIAGGSASTPHVMDAVGDAALSGIDPDVDPLTTPHDVTDVNNAWFSRSGGTVSVNITVTELQQATENQVFYVLWDYQGSDPAIKTKRFVSAQLRTAVPGVMPAGTFRYGYLDNTTPGVGTFTSEGYTTGSWTSGAPGTISIVVPLAALGNPSAGEALTNLTVESRLLVGEPGHGHPEVVTTGASGSGLVFVADDSANALDLCDSIIV